MTHREQRIYLIQALLAEDPRYADITIPADEQAQSDLLRSLMNVRLPKPISPDVLKIQDAYLQEERDRRGITACALAGRHHDLESRCHRQCCEPRDVRLFSSSPFLYRQHHPLQKRHPASALLR